MKLAAIDSIGELVGLFVSAVGTMLFTLGGFLVDQAGIQNVLTGNLTVGVWELWMGTIALVVGVYLFGYQQLWPRLKTLRDSF